MVEETTGKQHPLEKLNEAVYKESEGVEKGTPECWGYDFNKGLDYSAMFKTYKNTGFQATSLGQAIDEVNNMIKWRLSDEPIDEENDTEEQ